MSATFALLLTLAGCTTGSGSPFEQSDTFEVDGEVRAVVPHGGAGDVSVKGGVLEDVLRRDFPDPELLREIAARIGRKIDWPGEIDDPRGFLDDFYAAQRARLEQKLLMGERREEKVRQRRVG